MMLFASVAWAGAPKPNNVTQPADRIDPDSLTISVLRSTNASLDYRAAFYPFPFRPSEPVALEIRNEVGTVCSLEGLSESAAFEKALNWVHNQFQHDPLNSIADMSGTVEILRRARKGEQFTCVEFARVLSDILLSYGYCSRMVGLSRRNIGNPKTGARHVGVEVWSCSNNKWIYLDPQFGVRVTRASVGLNARELQGAIVASDPLLEINVCDTRFQSEPSVRDSTVAQYRRFIAGHSAFVDIPYLVNSSVGLLMLVPEDRLEPLLFQGKPLSNVEYTKDPTQLYASLGGMHMDLQYDYAANQPSEPLKSPAYQVTASTSCPMSRFFEVKFDTSGWRRMSASSVRWELHTGRNEIQIRALCSSGCYTQPCTMEAYFGLREDARRLRARISEKGESTR